MKKRNDGQFLVLVSTPNNFVKKCENCEPQKLFYTFVEFPQVHTAMPNENCILTNALSICPDKIFFSQDKTFFCPDKEFCPSLKSTYRQLFETVNFFFIKIFDFLDKTALFRFLLFLADLWHKLRPKIELGGCIISSFIQPLSLIFGPNL